jgi:hypothetical protein
MDRRIARRLLAWVPALAAIFAAALPLRAQLPPLTGEFRANTFTPGYQIEPRVASAGDGSFVVVWASDGQDGSYTGVFGQRFGRHGERAGAEFRVNTYTTSAQLKPVVAADAAGRFVVVWQSVQDGDQYGVFGQRFDASGAKLGPEFQVNSYTTAYQSNPAVAVRDSGDFVVVWSSFGQDGSRFGVFGQRFTAAGAKAGPEFRVNTITFGDQFHPAVGFDGQGRFTVAWTTFDFDDFGIYGQRFDASGAKIGSEFPVNFSITDEQDFAAVGLDGRGNFVVAWEGPDPYLAASRSIFARRFNSAGDAAGVEFQVNDSKTGERSNASVAVNRAGHFTVSWQTLKGSERSIEGQRFDRAGERIGTEFPHSATSPSAEISIADDGAGLVAAWRGPNDGNQAGIACRRQAFVPEALAVDSRTTPDTVSDANGVFEPGENPLIEPTWRNRISSIPLVGFLTKLSGPSGASYFLPDAEASYGTLPPDSAASCDDGAPDACYIGLIFTFGSRPATHWDAVLEETLTFDGGSHPWKLHLGESFSDVPREQPFYRKIETLLHNGITSGCTATAYCPETPVSREQMAIFVAKGIAGLADLIPTKGVAGGKAYDCSPGGHSIFSDVAPTSASCRHVHYLTAQNVTLGCGPTTYCQTQTITRDAMASFIAKATVAPGGGNAVPLSYGPDPGTGRSYSCNPGSPNRHFSDVIVSNAFCKHIHFLWAKGIVEGCSATQYCPGAPVARDAMAKFIANGFGLQLYGP